MASKPNYQAFRSSCDRCRFHKLKCTGSSSSHNPCDRCFRAKVECVFGRRASITRNPKSTGNTTSTAGNKTATTTTNTTTANTTSTEKSRRSNNTSAKNSVASTTTTTTTSSLDANSSNDETEYTSSTSYSLSRRGLSGSSAHSLSGDVDASNIVAPDPDTLMVMSNEYYGVDTDWTWPQFWDGAQDFAPNDQDPNINDEFARYSSLCEVDQSNQLQHLQQPFAPALTNNSNTIAPVTTTTNNLTSADFSLQTDLNSLLDDQCPLAILDDDKISQTNMLRLSSLVADIQRTANTLTDGPWAMPSVEICSSDMLSRYPIGSILHMVRKFRVILQDISRTHAQNARMSTGESQPRSMAGDLRMGGNNMEISSSGSSSPRLFGDCNSFPMIDTPTRLLALSCHISLIKLHGIVFTHLENILNMMPSSSQSSSLASSPRRDSIFDDDHLAKLRLCHLPSIDEACSKIHTAVSMMLQAFQSVEVALDALRNPGSTAFGPEVTSPRTPGTSSWYSSGLFRGVSILPHQMSVANVLGQDPVLGTTAVQEEFNDAFGKLQALKELLMRKLDMQ